MKNLTALLTALLLGFSPAAAQTWTSGSATCTLSNGTLTITGYVMKDYGSTSTLPWANSGITSVVIGSSVTHIGMYAFYNCASLTSVTFGSGVISIGEGAFRATGLQAVTLPASVTSIGKQAFYNCRQLTSVTMLGSTPATLGTDVFKSAKSGFCVTVPILAYLTYQANSSWKSHLCALNGYLVTFDAQGGSPDFTAHVVAKKGYAVQPANPTRTCYIFDGWYTNTSYYTPWNFSSTQVTANTTLYARWKAAPVVTFNANGGSVIVSSVTGCVGNDGRLAATPLPTRVGYTFNGWFTQANGGTQITSGASGTVFTANATVYARWDIGYIITFNPRGGTVSPAYSLTVNEKLTSLPTPYRSLYRFDGWYTDSVGGAAVTTTISYTESTTLYARWTYLGYNIVTFSSNGGTRPDWAPTPTTRNVYPADGLRLTSPLPAGNGYSLFECGRDSLVGWLFSGGVVTAGANGTVFNRHTTVNAQWQWVGDYKITLNPNGGTVFPTYTTNSIDYRISNYSIPTPIRAGYIFDGWFTSAVGGSRVTYGSGEVTSYYLSGADNNTSVHIHDNSWTFYAHWIPRYTITFDAQGGTVSPASGQTNAEYKLSSLPTPVRDGYSFSSWRTAPGGSTSVSVNTVFSANATLYAQWNYTGIFTVSFMMNDGTNNSYTTQPVHVSDFATPPAQPTRIGYTFGGWYADAACTTAWDFGNTIQGTTSIYAKWTIIGYTVAFKLNDGTNNSFIEKTVNFNTAVTAPSPAPTREGVNFGGWYTTAECTTAYNFSTAVTANLTLYAKWTCNAETCCTAGTQFVIKIPFRQLPPGDTVTYRWYRNGEFFSDGVATAGDTHIICTVPPAEAHGINVEFHFEYTLNDNHYGAWTTSPKYRVSFVP